MNPLRVIQKIKTGEMQKTINNSKYNEWKNYLDNSKKNRLLNKVLHIELR